MRPENPQSIIIKNEFYPSGLTEGKVFDHYIKYKKQILDEVGNRNLVFFIVPNINDIVIRRKINNKPIKINSQNYETIFTGRTLSIAVEMDDNTDLIVIDIDPGPGTKEVQLKNTVTELLNSSLKNISKKERVISTARSYHVYFYLKKSMNIETANQVCKKMLSADFYDKYDFGGLPPKGNNIKLDLAVTRNKGSRVVPYSLCRNGLMSMDVTKNYLMFNRKKAII